GVGDVEAEDDRGQDERAEHRPRPPSRRGCHHGGRGEKGGDDQRDRSVHVRSSRAVVWGAPPAAFAGSSGGGRRMTRPVPGRLAGIVGRLDGGSSVTALASGSAPSESASWIEVNGPKAPAVPSKSWISSFLTTTLLGAGSVSASCSRAPSRSVVAGGV